MDKKKQSKLLNKKGLNCKVRKAIQDKCALINSNKDVKK